MFAVFCICDFNCHTICYECYTGESSLKVNSEADSNDTTENPAHDKPTPYLKSGESTSEVKIEAQSNDTTEHLRDDKPRPPLCMVCDKQFKRKGELNRHKLMHTADRFYFCTECGKSYIGKHNFGLHMNVHSSKYRCTECGKGFHHNQALTRHRQTHSGEKQFRCSKQTVQSNTLVNHNNINSGGKPCKYLPSDKSFGSSGNLQEHKRYVHSNIRPYECGYCGKLFICMRDVKHHVYTHTGFKPYLCRHCSNCFTQRFQLKAHLLRSHNEGNWLSCHICQKKFCDNGHLNEHVLRHESVRLYLCSECPKSFRTAGDLKSHELRHVNVKRFCCASCGKHFKCKRGIVQHLTSCSAELRFEAVGSTQSSETLSHVG